MAFKPQHTIKNVSPDGASCRWIGTLSQGVLQDGKSEWERERETRIKSNVFKASGSGAAEELSPARIGNMHRCENCEN